MNWKRILVKSNTLRSLLKVSLKIFLQTPLLVLISKPLRRRAPLLCTRLKNFCYREGLIVTFDQSMLDSAGLIDIPERTRQIYSRLRLSISEQQKNCS